MSARAPTLGAAAMLCALISTAACTAAKEPLPPPELGEPVTVVPSVGLPAEAATQQANNNLDVIRFDGRIYLSFRTAPDHFASADTVLHVVSSADELSWDYEASFTMDTDLREPRFGQLGTDTLLLYFAVLGDSGVAFEPQGTMVSRMNGPGDWSAPESVLPESFIPWRLKQRDGDLELMGYEGGENIYEPGGDPVRVHFLRTDDGVDFQAAAPGRAVVHEGGVSETDWVWMDDGSLVAVGRNEAGNEGVWGSRICRGESDAPGDWTCTDDPKKYDSPLLFRHAERVILVGRRQVANGGRYDLEQRELSAAQQSLSYQLEYSNTPKRCAVWEVDPDELSVRHLVDLPSNGDTCFASVLDLGPVEDGHRYRLYNYSSPWDGPDMSWIQGQGGPTLIYRIDLNFPAP